MEITRRLNPIVFVLSMLAAGLAQSAVTIDSSAYRLDLGYANQVKLKTVGTVPMGAACTAQAISVGDKTVQILSDRTKATISGTRPLQVWAVCGEPPPNRPPVISGTPGAAVVNTAYSFTPTASDPDGDTLAFSIQNIPTWATFSTSTGKLSGTPSAGTYPDIKITVSDSKASVTLPAFTLEVEPPAVVAGLQVYTCADSGADGRTLEGDGVTWPNCTDVSFQTPSKSQVVAVNPGTWPFRWVLVSKLSDERIWTQTDGVGAWTRAQQIDWSGGGSTPNPPTAISVTMSWTAPTENTDGSKLDDLAGYRILYGVSPSELITLVDSNSLATSYIVNNLTPGTWYFAVRAYTAAGAESANSNVVSRTLN